MMGAFQIGKYICRGEAFRQISYGDRENFNPGMLRPVSHPYLRKNFNPGMLRPVSHPYLIVSSL
jgi:hypothetical protein